MQYLSYLAFALVLFIQFMQGKLNTRIFFATIGFIIVVASFIYLIITRNYGTPLRDYIEQHVEAVKLRDKSKKNRSKAWAIGVVVAGSIVLIFRPFAST